MAGGAEANETDNPEFWKFRERVGEADRVEILCFEEVLIVGSMWNARNVDFAGGNHDILDILAELRVLELTQHAKAIPETGQGERVVLKECLGEEAGRLLSERLVGQAEAQDRIVIRMDQPGTDLLDEFHWKRGNFGCLTRF